MLLLQNYRVKSIVFEEPFNTVTVSKGFTGQQTKTRARKNSLHKAKLAPQLHYVRIYTQLGSHEIQVVEVPGCWAS